VRAETDEGTRRGSERTPTFEVSGESVADAAPEPLGAAIERAKSRARG